MVQSMVGPAALALLLLARRVEPLRDTIDGNANVRLAALATMVTLVLYSLVFQLRLAKEFWEPRISRAFDQIGRR